MKTYLKNFGFYILLAAFFVFGNLQISAQLSKNAVAQLAPINTCFEENEAAVTAIASSKLNGNVDTLKRLNDSLPHLQKLVDCADKGSKIASLPLKTKRALLARKKEYLSAQEVFSTQSCIFSKLNDAEAGVAEISEKITEGKKAIALLKTKTIRLTATQAQICATQGINSRTIPSGMKSGFRENLTRINSMLEKIDGLQASIEKMPDK